MSNHPGSDWTEEHVLIENSGPADQDLSRWRLGKEASTAYFFPPGFILFGGMSVHVWSKGGIDTELELYWGREGPAWDGKSGVAYLWNDVGAVVDAVEW